MVYRIISLQMNATNASDCGEDLEDGEIFDDEVEPEEKAEVKENNGKGQNATPILDEIKPPSKTDSNLPLDFNSAPPTKKSKLSNRWGDENFKKEKGFVPCDDEKKARDKKKKRKRLRDEDDDEINGLLKFKDNSKKQRKSFEKQLEQLVNEDFFEDDDDDEMLFVRGASPNQCFDDEGFSEDDDDGGRRGGGGGFRGAGGPPRLDRNNRRERLPIRGKRRGRGGNNNMRKKRGGGGGGGGGDGDDGNVCIFFMQGKCHRGNECPFSHDAMPPRKMELCKFYLMDCCAKKDKCLYMHSEFPCKYFHMGLKCYAAKNCKFSHGKLTDSLSAVLTKTFGSPSRSSKEFASKKAGPGKQRQHLETAPKEILGDFPRIRDGGRNVKREKKIPSLFDIKVSMPNDMRSLSDDDGNHTPMPSPPPMNPNNQDNVYQDPRSFQREETPPDRRREPKPDKPNKMKGERESKRMDENHPKKEKKDRGGQLPKEEEVESRDQLSSASIASSSSNTMTSIGRHSNTPPPLEEAMNFGDHMQLPEPAEDNEMFPSHLPKKQRELFLRIKQQQRQAESRQASGEDEDEDRNDAKQEDNWYSSDEEPTPLSTILQNLANLNKKSQANSTQAHPQQFQPQQQPQQQQQQQQQLPPTAQQPSLLSGTIPDIDINEVSELLSKVKQHFQTTAAEKTKLRDPRLRNDMGPSGDSSADNSTSNSTSLLNRIPQLPPLNVAVAAPRDNQGGAASTSGLELRLKGSPVTGGGGDMDLRNLPFKPAPVHSAANEIDASINSHSPIPYRLLPLAISKPDYSTLQTMPRGGASDPRWRKAIRFNEESSSTTSSRRDPRHRLADDVPTRTHSVPSADPRQRLSGMMNLNSSPNHPPPTPRYDDDPPPQAHRNAFSGLNSPVDHGMMCPPTPRLEDDQPPSYVPPVRPTDPRQRHSALGHPPNMNMNINQGPSSVYDQLRQQQQTFHTQTMMFETDARMRGIYPGGMRNDAEMGMGLNNNRTQYNFKQ